MNQEKCLQIVGAPIRVRKYVTVEQAKLPREAKAYKSGKLKSPVARIVKFHGTCDRKVLNLKLIRLYFLSENQT